MHLYMNAYFVPEFAARTENGKQYSFLPLDSVASLFSESE